MFRLDGRTALVTGASQGIGEAVARRLAAQGARLVLAARNVAKLEALAAELGASGAAATPLALDLAATAEIAERLKALPAEFADIDILVNNAGITADNLLLRMSLEQWSSVLATNLTGAFVVTKELLRGMMKRRYGRVVTISSRMGSSAARPRSIMLCPPSLITLRFGSGRKTWLISVLASKALSIKDSAISGVSM
jgi:3-oxoacyl-[acyl-carrier protein] reductase